MDQELLDINMIFKQTKKQTLTNKNLHNQSLNTIKLSIQINLFKSNKHNQNYDDKKLI